MGVQQIHRDGATNCRLAKKKTRPATAPPSTSRDNEAADMFSPRRRKKKPLGYVAPESMVELHVEKALFRRNSEMIREMCTRAMKQKQDESLMPPNTPLPSGNISPEMRWLLTRSARLKRVNNAGFSKFSHRISERVGSANGRRMSNNNQSYERQRSMCKREEDFDSRSMRSLQCDVLGPKFCTDCTERYKKGKEMYEQRRHFPRIEVHQRSLVAPEKVEKMYLNHPDELFKAATKRSYECGCAVDPELEITTPLVYTPHEVFQRLRYQHRERGNNLFGKEKTKNVTRETTRPLYLEEKTEPPLDMKVSVTFRTS